MQESPGFLGSMKSHGDGAQSVRKGFVNFDFITEKFPGAFAPPGYAQQDNKACVLVLPVPPDFVAPRPTADYVHALLTAHIKETREDGVDCADCADYELLKSAFGGRGPPFLFQLNLTKPYSELDLLGALEREIHLRQDKGRKVHSKDGQEVKEPTSYGHNTTEGRPGSPLDEFMAAVVHFALLNMILCVAGFILRTWRCSCGRTAGTSPCPGQSETRHCTCCGTESSPWVSWSRS